MRARAGLAAIGLMLGVSACATVPAAPAANAPLASANAAPGFQYLYGSAEGAAISIQAWNALVAHVAQQVRAHPQRSVILAEGATLGCRAHFASQAA